MLPQTAIIIPARYGSSRFPGKPLAKLFGKPLIEHVFHRAKQVRSVVEVLVATDDERIMKAVEAFGGTVIMTSPEHRTGTDRVAEVAGNIEAEVIVNVQGDEPLIEPRVIEQALEPLYSDPGIQMSTLMTEITDKNDLKNPNVVKVVVDLKGYAIYFSRSLIPYPRNEQSFNVFKHIGLYVYRRQFLLDLAALKQTPLEKTESLEQLRALENGYKIKAIETDYNSIGVDTPEQLAQIEAELKE